MAVRAAARGRGAAAAAAAGVVLPSGLSIIVGAVTSSAVLLRPEPGPGTLKEVRWGGVRLARLRGGAEVQGRAIGESWELSTLPGHESRVGDRPLTDVLGGPLPFLVKLIDTAKPLSIQVHPDDAYEAGRPGKEEAWVILDAEDGAELLCGLADGVSRAALGEAVAQANAAPDHDAVLIDRLRRHAVKPGTCIVVPAGTVHAIGPGILLMEIQQPVDRTFRLYDYGSGRELHVQHAIAATHVDGQPVTWDPSEAPRVLEGQHVRLFPGRGAATLACADAPQVVVVVRGDAVVTAGSEREELGPGDLLLVRNDAELSASADTTWVRAGLTRAGS